MIDGQKMLYAQLSARTQNLGRLLKRMRGKISFRVIVPGKRIRPFDNPVGIVAIAFLADFATSTERNE